MKWVRYLLFIVFHVPGYAFIGLYSCYAATMPLGRNRSFSRKVIQWKQLVRRGDLSQEQFSDLVKVAQKQFIRDYVEVNFKYLTRISLAVWIIVAVVWAVFTYPSLYV